MPEKAVCPGCRKQITVHPRAERGTGRRRLLEHGTETAGVCAPEGESVWWLPAKLLDFTDPLAIDLAQADPADEEPTILTVPLAQRYGFPPFSVIDRRSGIWQARKRKWNALGLDSVDGRRDDLLGGYKTLHSMNPEQYKTLTATSVFDPALCELSYSWFSPPGGQVLDPFAGGSVRGVVASRMGRHYTGVDLSTSQIEANERQAHLADPDHPIRWINGDSNEVVRDLLSENGGQPWADMIFSCPPYFDLESYSDGDADLSAMTYPEFVALYAEIIDATVACLKEDRFIGWVISDVRDPRGYYRGLCRDTEQAFEDAGAHLYNELILTDPVGSVAVRAARPFDGSRKLARLHQKLYVFVKGDPRKASADLNIQIEESERPAMGASDQPALF